VIDKKGISGKQPYNFHFYNVTQPSVQSIDWTDITISVHPSDMLWTIIYSLRRGSTHYTTNIQNKTQSKNTKH